MPWVQKYYQYFVYAKVFALRRFFKIENKSQQMQGLWIFISRKYPSNCQTQDDLDYFRGDNIVFKVKAYGFNLN
jgi:hypothetical protein